MTAVSLGCDAQVDKVFPPYAVEEVIIWLLLLATQKPCTANTCRMRKHVSLLFLCKRQRAAEHMRRKKKQLEGQKLKDNSSALKYNYKCQCTSQ